MEGRTQTGARIRHYFLTRAQTRRKEREGCVAPVLNPLRVHEESGRLEATSLGYRSTHNEHKRPGAQGGPHHLTLPAALQAPARSKLASCQARWELQGGAAERASGAAEAWQALGLYLGLPPV